VSRLRGKSVQATAAFDEKPETSAVQRYAPDRSAPSNVGPVIGLKLAVLRRLAGERPLFLGPYILGAGGERPFTQWSGRSAEGLRPAPLGRDPV
jgi:hypothetical protein